MALPFAILLVDYFFLNCPLNSELYHSPFEKVSVDGVNCFRFSLLSQLFRVIGVNCCT